MLRICQEDCNGIASHKICKNLLAFVRLDLVSGWLKLTKLKYPKALGARKKKEKGKGKREEDREKEIRKIGFWPKVFW